MDSLRLLHTFREVAAHRSFTRAAFRLRISKPTVSKHISELEKRFEVRLLNRSTRAVSLTDAGRVLLDRSGPLVDMAASTTETLREHAAAPCGRLRLAISHGLEYTRVPFILAEFVRKFPEVHVDLQIANGAVDFARDGFDIALRIGRVHDEYLIVRRLAKVESMLCATPAYWARKGIPKHPDELIRHEVLRYSGEPIGERSHPPRSNGCGDDAPQRARLEADDPSLLLGLALEGLGVVSVPCVFARPHIQRGQLVAVLSEYLPKDQWFHAAYVQRRHNSAALRSFLEHLETSTRAGFERVGSAGA